MTTQIRDHLFKNGATDFPYEHNEIERRRQDLWKQDERFTVTQTGPTGGRMRYIKPSAPFTSGNIHMGHVRSYAIADAYARFCRARGDQVLMAFGFDAFGLPAEMEATKRGIDPNTWVHECAAHMTEQLTRLGFSFDWSRSFISSDNVMYRWSQWLFLTLLEHDLVYQAKAPVWFCGTCMTTLAEMQVEQGMGGITCWRCHKRVTTVIRDVWMLRIENYIAENDVSNITGDWDKVALRSQETVAEFAHDWPISRERKWGTTVPMMHCTDCGEVPVPKEWLPVVGGARGFCPQCNEDLATVDHHTLDCHFDALWLWIAPCLTWPSDARASVGSRIDWSEELRDWLPADRIVAGSDSGNFMYNQRIVTKMLRDIGCLDWIRDGESFVNATLHEMVLADGRKMSKHVGNVVDPDHLVQEYGADAVRTAILYAAKPSKPLDWTEDAVEFCHGFLTDLWYYTEAWKAASTVRDTADVTLPMRRKLDKWTNAAVRNVTADLIKLEMHKAIRSTIRFFNLIKQFEHNARDRRGAIYDADKNAILDALDVLLRLLAPFAPHMTEELMGVHSADGMPWPTTDSWRKQEQ